MVGVEVPTAAAAEGGPVVEEDRPYVATAAGLRPGRVGASDRRRARLGARGRPHPLARVFRRNARKRARERRGAPRRRRGRRFDGALRGARPGALRCRCSSPRRSVRLWSWPAFLPTARSGPSAGGRSCGRSRRASGCCGGPPRQFVVEGLVVHAVLDRISRNTCLVVAVGPSERRPRRLERRARVFRWVGVRGAWAAFRFRKILASIFTGR